MKIFPAILFAAALVTCAPARAESLADYVSRQQAGGMIAAREIHAAMFRKATTTEWVRVVTAKPAAIYAIETNAVARLTAFVKAVNPAETNALARIQGMETTEMVDAVGKRLNAEPQSNRDKLKGDLTKSAVELLALHLTLEKKGINFRDPSFGKPNFTTDVLTDREGLSWWDINKPVGNPTPPTVAEIRALMR